MSNVIYLLPKFKDLFELAEYLDWAEAERNGFDPSQETYEEYLRRKSLVRNPCDLQLDELILPHGLTRR